MSAIASVYVVFVMFPNAMAVAVLSSPSLLILKKKESRKTNSVINCSSANQRFNRGVSSRESFQ